MKITPLSIYHTEVYCRSCASSDLCTVLDYGETPLADCLVKPNGKDDGVIAVPLTLRVCNDCGLLQIAETVSPEVLFSDEYPYFSSVSPSLVRHFQQSAQEIIAMRGLNGNSLVIEAASNDGCMLQNFKQNGIPVLGIDPAGPPVEAATRRGIETIQDFFTKELAETLRGKGYLASVFLANNVLAHVADLNGFVSGIADVLEADGLAVLEVPYVLDLADKIEFDTVYHQHLCYFSVTVLVDLFERHGLHLNRVQRIPIHGGSLRLYFEHSRDPDESVLALLDLEHRRGAAEAGFFLTLASRAARIKRDLISLLTTLKAEGKRIAAYGAAAKGTTLLSYCGITREVLDYVVDLNEFKHGLLFGRDLLPIYPTERLLLNHPDYVLILAWNFAAEIMQQQREFSQTGGRFIIPIPEPVVI